MNKMTLSMNISVWVMSDFHLMWLQTNYTFFFFFRCAELLVMKAELELMHGEREESRMDLDKVRNLLETCTGLEMHKSTNLKGLGFL